MAKKSNQKDVSAEQWEAFASSRRSTRDFLPKSVDPQIIDALLKDAMTAPSWSNTRPYLVAVATGDRRDRISVELVKRIQMMNEAKRGGLLPRFKFVLSGFWNPKSEYPVVKPYPKDLNPRRMKVGKELYQTLGVKRGDAKARDEQLQRNFEFFGAPVVIFIFTHKGLGEYSVLDAGFFLQNLILSAHARGLGTCAQGMLAIWPGPVRREFKTPKQYKLLVGVSIGYPSQAKVNSFEAERIPISEIIVD